MTLPLGADKTAARMSTPVLHDSSW